MDCLNFCNTVFKRVDELPSLIDATRNHAYITPDNNIYIINADGTGYMQMSTGGSGGVTVGLSSNDGSITIVETNDGVTNTFDIKVSEEIIQRLTEIGNRNQEQERRLSDIEARDIEQYTRLNAIEDLNKTQNTLLDEIMDKNRVQDNKLDNLQTSQTSLAIAVSELENKAGGGSSPTTVIDKRLSDLYHDEMTYSFIFSSDDSYPENNYLFNITLTIQKSGVRGDAHYTGMFLYRGGSYSYSIPIINLLKPFDIIGVRMNMSLAPLNVDVYSPNTDIYITGVHVEGVSI